VETAVFSLFSLFPNIKLKRAGESRRDIRGHPGSEVNLRLLESEIWTMGHLQTSAPPLLKVRISKKYCEVQSSLIFTLLGAISSHLLDSILGCFRRIERD
jgi:hypothetical protein